MPLTQFFRRLLLLYILFNIAEAVFTEMTLSWLPEPLRGFEEARYNASDADPEMVFIALLWLVTTLLLIVSLVGLWNFWRPARGLFGTSILLSILLVGLTGPFVASALSFTVIYTESILSGLVLALVYFSPIKELFEKKPPQAPSPEPGDG
jgi:hypothetical protein